MSLEVYLKEYKIKYVMNGKLPFYMILDDDTEWDFYCGAKSFPYPDRGYWSFHETINEVLK